MSIPAVSKARNLIVSTVCRFPLRALDANGPLANQPTWLYRTDTEVTPYERLAAVLDDLIFFGFSLLVVERGAAGQITKANWCPMEQWTITDGRVLVDSKAVPEDSYLLINSAFDGLLNIGNRTLRGARDIENSWVSKVRNPIPLTVLRQESGESITELEQDEITDLLSQWSVARRDKDGALGFLPAGLQLETHGLTDPALLIEGRNALRTDIGSFLNVPTQMLDGSLSTASLTYSTQEGTRSKWLDDLQFWLQPIEARLSMDDAVPRGTRVRFDLTEAYAALPNPTAAPEAD
ncbi:phage portal protein [Herbiconiux sp. 11R-BC]|uniref:hypothetical protein n=1 Tax=Herbiconiux sp. 11R-BC TaxID=3111637 RepID=UPI003C0FA5E3